MDPIAGHLDVAAAHGGSGQHAFVYLSNVGGMNLPLSRLLLPAHRCLL
jgi:hypothetical protein